jgi:DNA polymerase III delta prime subunit
MPNLTDVDYDIFLSHSTADKEWVLKLVERLKLEKYRGRKLRVFYSPLELRPGQHITNRILEALSRSRYVAIVESPAAFESKYVGLEVDTTLHAILRDKRKGCLIPLFLRECEVPAALEQLCRINFTDPSKFEEGYNKLLAVLKDKPLELVAERALPSLHPSIPSPPTTGYVPRFNDKGQDILKLLRKTLAPGKNQLVSLWGPGGTGKTTLAIMIAREMFKEFAGRVVWVNGHVRPDFSLSTMLDIIARRLGRPDFCVYSLEQKKEEVGELVNGAPTLIVLDNFEEIEPAEQKNCEEWFTQGVYCSALITTRERIKSARNIAVKGMTRAEARDLLNRLIKEEERDRAAFDGLNHDRLIKAAEYNPHVLSWIVMQISYGQNPDEVLHEIAEGRGEAAERVFDRSFNLSQVGDDGRSVLLALSLFASRATRRALATVAGLGDHLDRFNEAVKNLSNLWLVETRENNEKLFVRGLTRECLKKHLDKSERADEFRRHFVAYFLKYAEEHAGQGKDDFSALESEKENGSYAIVMAFRQRDWKSVIKFFVALKSFLDQHKYWGDLISLSEQALVAAQMAIEERLIDRDAELNALAQQIPSIIGIEHQNHALAEETYTEALRFYKAKWKDTEKVPEERKTYAYHVGITMYQIGVLRQYKDKRNKAQGWYRWAERFLNERGSQRGIAAIMNNLGAIAEREGRLKEAANLFRQALDIFNKLDPPSAYAVIAEKNLKRVESSSVGAAQ